MLYYCIQGEMKSTATLFLLCFLAGYSFAKDAETYAIPANSCGLNKYNPTGLVVPRPYIVGGQVAVANYYPWQVSLQQFGEHACGGSIISDRYVLTAAHCFDGGSFARLWTVVAGKHSLAKLELTQKSYNIEKIIKHEKYNVITNVNDIALIKLSTKIVFTDEIQPVCLPPATVGNLAGSDGIITGWGATYEDGDAVTLLREVTLPIITNTKCQSKFTSETITSSMMCAGYDLGGKDSCQGDSGGPMIQERDGVYIQVGVVSWGYGCGNVNSPGVYSRVTSYLDWIKSNMV